MLDRLASSHSSSLQRLPWIALVLGLSTWFGCQESHSGRSTSPVVVTISYAGKPVEGAIVTFAIPNNPPPAYGKTDINGKAHLTTYVAGDGALIGRHTVTIVKQAIEKNVGQDQGNQETGEYLPAVGASPIPVAQDFLPARYRNPSTSGLVAEVKATKNEFVFELEDGKRDDSKK